MYKRRTDSMLCEVIKKNIYKRDLQIYRIFLSFYSFLFDDFYILFSFFFIFLKNFVYVQHLRYKKNTYSTFNFRQFDLKQK